MSGSLAVIGGFELAQQFDDTRSNPEQQENKGEEVRPERSIEIVADRVANQGAARQKKREAEVFADLPPLVIGVHLAASLLLEDRVSLFGRLFYQEPHLGMARRNIRRDAVFFESFGRRRADRRNDDVFKPGAHPV